ncbi:MAG: LytR C-terminal domain-containing protein [Pseudomonadota bacterium]
MKRSSISDLTRTSLALSAGLLLSGCSLDLGQWFGGNAAAEDKDTVVASGSLYLQRGRQAFERGDYGIAISMLEQELGRNDASVAALNGLGASYDQLGRHDVARRYYFRALDLAPDSDMTLANLGYSYQLEGRADDSVRVYELALSEAPDNTLALAQLPRVREQLQQPESDATEVVRIDGSVFATAASSDLLAERPALLQVSNGNGVRGIAGATARAVDTDRFRVTGLDNTPGYDVPRTRILHRPHFRDQAEELARTLDLQADLQETTLLETDVDLRLVLGHDFARRVIVANDELRPRPDAALDDSLRLEVANGNGINGMAARVREYLRERGGSVVRISNAEHFEYDHSVIYYRSGQRQQVEGLLATLPLRNVSLLESDELAANVDVRVLLGRDYIPYDAG